MRCGSCFGRLFCGPFLGLSWGPVKGRWYLCGVSPQFLKIRIITISKAMGCNMSLKIHFLKSHLAFFLRKSRQNQWRTRRKISPRCFGYGKRYQAKWTSSMLADYCWTMKKDVPDAQYWRATRLYILEDCFCLFRVHIKYYFRTLKLLCILETLPDRKLGIYIWIQHRKYWQGHLLKFLGQKKVEFCWPVIFLL
jgi:hypothetical protein